MADYVCPNLHLVREPGRMGRSWCPICDSYEIATESDEKVVVNADQE